VLQQRASQAKPLHGSASKVCFSLGNGIIFTGKGYNISLYFIFPFSDGRRKIRSAKNRRENDLFSVALTQKSAPGFAARFGGLFLK
jgi:hypothetical protein